MNDNITLSILLGIAEALAECNCDAALYIMNANFPEPETVLRITGTTITCAIRDDCICVGKLLDFGFEHDYNLNSVVVPYFTVELADPACIDKVLRWIKSYNTTLLSDEQFIALFKEQPNRSHRVSSTKQLTITAYD